MITRHYFISAQKPHGDGKLSYSFQFLTFSRKSWFCDSNDAFNSAKNELLKQFKECGYDGDKIDIQAFNRI